MFKHIRTRFFFIAGLISLLFFASFIGGTYRIYGSHVVNVSLENKNISTQTSANLIEKIIINHLKPISLLATNIAQYKKINVYETVLSLNKLNDYYAEIAIVDLNGQAYYADGSILDLSDRPYIKKVLQGNTAISDLIISRKTGEDVIMAAVPLYGGMDYREKEIEGALIGRILINELVESIMIEHPHYGMSRIIVSQSNQLIFSDGIFDRKKTEWDIDFFLQNLNKDTLLTGSNFYDMEYMGNAYYVTIAGIDRFGWTLYELIPKKNVREPVKQILYYLSLVSIPLIFLFIIIVIIVTNRTSSIILSIVDMFESGAKGDFNQRAEIKRIDEYGRLLHSYNKLMDTINTLTYFDSDTSLPNKKVLLQEIDNYIQQDSHIHLGLVCASVQGLEKIKNSNMEDFNAILNNIKGIKKLFPSNSLLYKHSSEMFILLIPDYGSLTETSVSGKINAYLEEIHGYHHYGNTLRISMGVYFRTDKNNYINPLDAVLAAVKYSSDKQIKIHFFNNNTLNGLNHDDELRRDIVNALDNNEFFLQFQPIVDINSGKRLKSEALIRWNHKEKGFISPEKFISVAETSSSIITRIDFFVIEKVCQLLSRRNNKSVISINVTSHTFEHHAFIQRLDELIRHYAVPPEFIQFEITERLMMKNTEQNIKVLEKLKKMNFKVALDDFGVGYSSLNYLSNLPIDIIKIDRSFIKQINTSQQSQLLIKGIIQMASIMNMEIIAEGIEDENEIKFLSENDCTFGQGFYFSKAVDFSQLKETTFLPKEDA